MALVTPYKSITNSLIVLLLLLLPWTPLIADAACHHQVTTPSSSIKVYLLGQKEHVMMGETFPGRKMLQFRKDYEEPDPNVNPGSSSIPPPSPPLT